MGNYLAKYNSPAMLRYLELLSSSKIFREAVMELDPNCCSEIGRTFENVTNDQWLEFLDKFFIPREKLNSIEGIIVYLTSEEYGVWRKFDVLNFLDVKRGEKKRVELDLNGPALVIVATDTMTSDELRDLHSAINKEFGISCSEDDRLDSRAYLTKSYTTVDRMLDVYALKMKGKTYKAMLPELIESWGDTTVDVDQLSKYFNRIRKFITAL